MDQGTSTGLDVVDYGANFGRRAEIKPFVRATMATGWGPSCLRAFHSLSPFIVGYVWMAVSL